MGLLNIMPGETYGIPDNTQNPSLLDNPALQMGLSILANNQGNYGSFGAAIGKGGLQGLQGIQRQQEAMRQQKLMDLHAQQIQAQQAEAQRRAQQESESKESTLRLLGGDLGAYQTMQEQPFTRTENVPQAPMPDAQAPNFNTMPQTVTGVNKVPQFDNNKYMQDVINAGYGNKLLERQFAQKEPMKLGANDRLIDPSTYKELVSAAPDKASTTSLGKMIAEYNALPPGSPLRAIYKQAIQKETTFAPPMVVQNYPAPMAAINPATGQQELVQFGNKGDARPTGFKPVGTEKPATEAQAKAATFYSQMTSASDELNNLTQSDGYDPTTLKGQLGASMATGVTNPLAGAGAQRARQAQNQWAESFLRVKTGAAATKDEVRMNVETFFPKLGDTPAVIQQKARMRTQAENDVKAMTANPNNILPKDAALPPKQAAKAMPKSKSIRLDNGKSVIGILGADGNYYVTSGGKKYRVEE